MRYLLIFFIAVLPASFLFSQSQEQRSITSLLQQKRFADAYQLMDSLSRMTNLGDSWHCEMLKLVREHNFHQRRQQIFYLRNQEPDGSWSNRNLSVRRPQRFLEKLAAVDSASGCGHLQLGLFYLYVNDLQFQDPDQRPGKAYPAEKIYARFVAAAENGVSNPVLNRWLGIHYFDQGDVSQSRELLERNIAAGYKDPPTYLYLAEIFFTDKQFSRSYNYALQALQMDETLDPEVHYSILRLAALSLQELGETARFVEYIIRAIQLFPDEQQTYFVLAEHFIGHKDLQAATQTYRQMLLNNPYDREGYLQVEKYCVNLSDYYFGENLLDEIMVTFDGDEEALSLVHEFRGNLLYHQGMLTESAKEWKLSREYLRKFLPANSPRLQHVGDIAKGRSER